MAAFEHAGEMTDSAVVPRALLKETVVGMAHFAGTGPAGAYCGGCDFWTNVGVRKAKMICGKYRSLTGDSKKAVPSDCRACRWYQPRPKTA